jgi:trk system potassium uptake protein TrkH
LTKLIPLLLFKNEEFKTYFGMVFTIAILLVISLFVNMHYTLEASFTHAFFNVASLVSSTGFCSIDYAKWDYVSKILLFAIMLFGSCASSAGGGLKVTRWILILKIMKYEMMKILHPKAVYNIKIGNYSVPKDILYQTLMFVSFYFAMIVLSAFLIAIIEQNTTVAVVGSVAAIGNIGPGFGAIGPMENFASLEPVTKIILIIDMLAGRLELIPFLVLFQKDLWVIKK